MPRVHKVSFVVLGVLLLAASPFAIAAASGSNAVAHMSVRSTGVKRTLLSKEGTVQPGEFSGATGTCPKKYPTPVSGWFSAKSDKVVLAESIPLGAKKWAT